MVKNGLIREEGTWLLLWNRWRRGIHLLVCTLWISPKCPNWKLGNLYTKTYYLYLPNFYESQTWYSIDLILGVVGFWRRPDHIQRCTEISEAIPKIGRFQTFPRMQWPELWFGFARSQINGSTAFERTNVRANKRSNSRGPITSALLLRNIEFQGYYCCYSSEYVSLENWRTGQEHHHLPKNYFSH